MMEVIQKRLPTLLGLALVGVFVLAACGTTIQPGSDATSSATGDAADQLPADFTITVYAGADILGGQAVRFSDLFAQEKPVVLNMWAGLCPPCRLEMPDFQAVHSELGDQVLFFGLDVGPFTNLGSSGDGRALIQSLGVTYPTGTTSDAEVVRAYELVGMPTTVFIKPNGEINHKWTGLLTEEKLTDLVEALLDAATGS
jgi:thiol-disulfide isomerase/thioredoxin